MDATPLIVVGSSVLATLTVLLVFAAGWIAARRTDRSATRSFGKGRTAETDGPAVSRIVLADVRERLRRLEAIAAGIDL